MSATTKNALVMSFVNFENKIKSIRIIDPKADLTAATVQAAMELFNDLKVFESINGGLSATIKGAKTVQTVTSDFGIEIG